MFRHLLQLVTKIELIFDNNNLTNWITLNSTYTKENALTTGRYLANTTGTFFTTNVTGIGTIYGEWVQIKYPKRIAINNVFFIPESLPRAIMKGYLLGSNNGITWNVVFGEFIVSTWTNFVERSLLGVYAQNTKQFLYYRLVTTQIQGVTSGGLNSTKKFAIAGLRFTYNEYVIYSDSILCVGSPTTGEPTGDCILDVNGGSNIQGAVKITGNVGIGTTTTSDVDDNTSIIIPTAQFYVRGGTTTRGTCDVMFRGGVAGQNGGKSRLWLAGDVSHSTNIQGEHLWVISSGLMTVGSLTIGNITQNYGGQSGAVANIAGLMMECSDGTEISIHDNNTSVHSFMKYD